MTDRRRFAERIWGYLRGVNGIIFILYLIFVFSTYGFLARDIEYLPIYLVLVVVLSFIIGPLVLKLVSRLRLNGTELISKKSYSLLKQSLFFIIPLFVFALYYSAYYPGGFSPDSIDQYQQAVGNIYSDWHPVLHTLIAFKLPLTITGGWVGSMALFQMLAFSLALAYTFNVIMKYIGMKYTFITMAYILLNPQTGYMAVFVLKDVLFAIGALLLSVFALQIYISRGKWINKTTHTAAFIIIAALTTLFRHNALLFTIPLIIAAVIVIAKKRALMICLCIITLIFGVKVPLYSAVGAESPGSRQVEVLGLPMTAIGAAVTMTPEHVDDDILEFAYKVAPKEVWEKKFRYGDYNTVKWDDRTNNSVIEEYGAAKVVSMALRCLKSSKAVTIKSLIKLTEPVYTLSDAYGEFLTPPVAENDTGISQNGVKALQDCLGGYKAFIEDVFPHLFLYLGAVHLIIIASILAKLKLNRFADWKRIFFVLPMLIYNYGTTLLLTGYHDADRFFYYSFLLLPVLLVFVFYNETENNEIDNTERKAVETAKSII